ncbi:hypothetical protein QYE76_030904 [Lolium multiflorum]|uniref:Uncharacterized protein n=1 Tax=Lolium multiflorum TaxID=4521 RepID=A0AAD8QQR7_LOLMU|nr:hypothetical protein QYE76_030904 [Lolium multiflorum]
MPPVIPPPATGARSSSAPPPGAPGSSSQGEPSRRSSQPTIGDMLQCRRPEGPAAGAGGAAPEVVVLHASPKDAPPPPESTAPTGPLDQVVPPTAPEPSMEEPARPADADARALVKAKGPAQAPQDPPQPLVSLHVSPAASLLNVVSAPDSSLGSAGTTEKDWRDADVHEVTSRDGSKGMASMEMFFSDFCAYAKACAAEADHRLKRVEKVNKSVVDKRTALYNRLVANYHKAKVERADMARELEATQVPQVEEDLRAAHAQCAESEKAVKAAAVKAQETEGEVARLRRLKANHLIELDSIKRCEQEKVDDLSRWLDEVDGQCRKLHEEVTSKSEELTATAKRWVEKISALEHGLAAAFPEAQQAALDAAGKAGARRQATARQARPHFSMDDYLASMAARVEPITMLGYELCVEDALSAETKTRRLARACAIANFVNKGVFVDMADAEDDAPEADPVAGADAPPAGPPPAGA